MDCANPSHFCRPTLSSPYTLHYPTLLFTISLSFLLFLVSIFFSLPSSRFCHCLFTSFPLPSCIHSLHFPLPVSFAFWFPCQLLTFPLPSVPTSCPSSLPISLPIASSTSFHTPSHTTPPLIFPFPFPFSFTKTYKIW